MAIPHRFPRLAPALMALALVLSACGAAQFKVDPAAAVDLGARASAAGSFQNPVLDVDFPDPMVLRASDGWYYAYATGSFDGTRRTRISVSRSKDLVHWDAVREALPVAPAWTGAKEKFWAPHVVEDHGTYLMYYSAEPAWSESEHMRLAVAVAKSPLGPFTDVGEPMAVPESAEENLDPAAFDDPKSGVRYLYWGLNGEVVVQPLTADRRHFQPGTSPKVMLKPSHSPYENIVEGPYVVSHGGLYYMFYSGDDCCVQAHYAVMVARAEKPTGPFQKLEAASGGSASTILTGNDRWRGPGHNAMVTDARGQDWLVYHAVDPSRPVIPGTGNVRRALLIDPVSWQYGWPAIDSGSPSTRQRSAPRGR